MSTVYIENEPHQFRGFSDRDVRKKFVVKVYTLLMIQLVITVGIITGCMFIPPVHEYLQNDIFIMVGTLVPAFGMHISLMCCKCARLYVPLNFILLTFMSVLYGIGFGSMSARMSTYIVFAALGLTVAIVAVLTIVAALPCFDMTGWGIYLCFAGIGLVTFGSVALILGMVFRLRIMFLVYSILITVIYSLYLIYDTQLILGGRKYEISSEEYIVGTVCLYTDFIYIFLALMNIINCMQ